MSLGSRVSLQNEGKLLNVFAHTARAGKKEESQKRCTTRLNVSRQREGGHLHPDREAAAGRQGGKSRKKRGKIHVRNSDRRVRRKTRGKKLLPLKWPVKRSVSQFSHGKTVEQTLKIQTLSNSSSVASGNFSWRVSFSTLEMKRIPYLTDSERRSRVRQRKQTAGSSAQTATL